jgi:hypothetical protein
VRTLVPDLVVLLLMGTLAGLVTRGRLRACASFSLYLIACLFFNRLITWWPQHFLNRPFWTFKESCYIALKFAIAIELCIVALQGFPRARRLALAAVGIVATITVASLATTSVSVESETIAAAQAGVVWAFAGVLFIALWFHLPLFPFYRMVMLGFGLYVGLYGGVLGMATWIDPRGGVHRYLAALDAAAYAATIGLWALAAWAEVGTPANPVARSAA